LPLIAPPLQEKPHTTPLQNGRRAQPKSPGLRPPQDSRYLSPPSFARTRVRTHYTHTPEAPSPQYCPVFCLAGRGARGALRPPPALAPSPTPLCRHPGRRRPLIRFFCILPTRLSQPSEKNAIPFFYPKGGQRPAAAAVSARAAPTPAPLMMGGRSGPLPPPTQKRAPEKNIFVAVAAGASPHTDTHKTKTPSRTPHAPRLARIAAPFCLSSPPLLFAYTRARRRPRRPPLDHARPFFIQLYPFHTPQKSKRPSLLAPAAGPPEATPPFFSKENTHTHNNIAPRFLHAPHLHAPQLQSILFFLPRAPLPLPHSPRGVAHTHADTHLTRPRLASDCARAHSHLLRMGRGALCALVCWRQVCGAREGHAALLPSKKQLSLEKKAPRTP
jgi:hypothetical protein